MADTKITALTALTAADPANDVIPIVDVSDTTMAASGTTKKITPNQILGSGGTATLASATITGAATVGTTLGVTGVSTLASATITGAATVGTTLGVTGQLSTANVVKATGNPGISAAGATEAFVAHNTTYGAVLYGQGTTYDAALLDRNTNLRLTVTTSGAQVDGNLSMTSGNVVMATSGKGIDFSATAGTGTSELLADYEEGAWTPTSTSGSNLTSIVHLLAQYTKVGRVVTLSGYFSATVTTGSTLTYATLAGLPFAVTLGQAGSVYEDVTLKVGFSQTNAGDLNVFFAAGTALASGSKTFTYTITYQV